MQSEKHTRQLWIIIHVGNQSTLGNTICKNIFFSRIDDISLNKWYTDVLVSSLFTLYRQFKQQKISLRKYRCTNSRLPIYNHIRKAACKGNYK